MRRWRRWGRTRVDGGTGAKGTRRSSPGDLFVEVLGAERGCGAPLALDMPARPRQIAVEAKMVLEVSG